MTTSVHLTTSVPLAAHPAAEVFPLLSEEEYQAFKADIATHGLREPIWLYEGRILDGRNRYRACRELGIAPLFRTYTGDSPVAFVWSLNGERRHLDVAQRAAIGAEMLATLQEESRKRQLANLRRGNSVLPPMEERAPASPRRRPRSVDEAARIVNAGATNISYAHSVMERDPALFQKIKAGEVNVKEAYLQVRGRAPAKPQSHVSRGAPRERRIADIRRLAQEGNRMEQIAAQLGISEKRVSLIAHAAGITLADASFLRSHKIRAHRVIEETVSSLEGLALGLRTVAGLRLEFDPAETTEWVKSIDASMRVINRLRKYLRGVSHE